MRIMYVPLDNRPVNTMNVYKLAEASGVTLVTPTAVSQIGGKSLDPFRQFGNPDNIVSWIDNQLPGTFDGFILSTDMIAFGGLVASRELIGSDATRNTLLAQAENRLQVIDRIRNAHPTKPIYLLDTVMRLATTSFVSNLDHTTYDNMRNMMRQTRRTYTNHADIKSGYAHKPGSGSYQAADFGLTGTQALSYYRRRQLKFDLNWHLMDKVRNSSNLFIVYGVDDASPDGGVQTNEINWIQGRINAWLGGSSGQNPNRAMIMPDADGLGMALLGKMVRQLLNVQTRYSLSYFGTGHNEPTTYEYTTVDQNLRLHVQLVGGTVVTRTNAEIDVLVQSSNNQHTSLVNQMNSNYLNNIPTVVLAAGRNLAANVSMQLAEAVLNSSNGPRLLSYSTWNTPGNRMGITLGHAAARYAFMRGATGTAEATKAQSELLAKEFIKDYAYSVKVRPGLREFINDFRNHPNVHQNFNQYVYTSANLPLTPAERADAVNELRNRMRPQVEYVLKRFCGRRAIHNVTGLRTHSYYFHGYNTTDVTNIVNSLDYTWDRAFEIDINPFSRVQTGAPSCPAL